MEKKLTCVRKKRFNECNDKRYDHGDDCKCNDLFLTVADGDFAFPKVIEKSVLKAVKSRSLAYANLDTANKNAVIKYYNEHFKYAVKPEDIVFANGVLYWIQLIINNFSKKGEGVLSLSPVYNYFSTVVNNSGRKDLKSELILKDNKFSIDFKDLEAKLKKSKVLIWCSPHNPTGNVWSHEDTEKVFALAKKYKVIVASDEIWQDVIVEGEHSLSLKYAKYVDNVVHISSPVKTYNLGGLQMGLAIIQDPKLRDKIIAMHQATIHYSSSNLWTSSAIQAAYGNPEAWAWVKLYLEQIKRNNKILSGYLSENKIEFSKADSTYLIFANIGQGSTEEKTFKILKKHGLNLSPGAGYGKQYKTWARINIAISDKSMESLINKLELVFKDLK